MSDKRTSPLELRGDALVDYATDDRIDRVWERVEADLPSTPTRSRAVLWWAPAAVVIVFGSGVLVGARWTAPMHDVATSVAPEPVRNEQPGAAEQPEPPRPVHVEEPEEKKKEVRQRKQAFGVPTPAVHEVEVVEQAEETPAAEPAKRPEWERLAEDGDFEKARGALKQYGGFDAVIGNATSAQLMNLYDIARATGRRDVARRVLERAVELGGSYGALAALSLANMLEKDGDRAGAVKYLAESRRLSPKGDLAEDALVRQVEVAVEQGDSKRARELADQYKADFPDGDGLDKLLPKLAELEEQTAATADAGVVEPPANDEDPPPTE